MMVKLIILIIVIELLKRILINPDEKLIKDDK